MNTQYIKRRLVDPFIMPLAFIGLLALMVITIGETLLTLFQPGDTKDRLDRPELWFALGLSVIVIFGIAFLASRPQGTLGPVDRDLAVGSRTIFEDPLPPIDVRARTGPLGTVADIGPGYTLYADSGALAEVRGVLPGSVDFGKRFQGFLYGRGLSGASSELWIPVEAVMSVYPETKSAFLSIKGDETEHFGWSVPPESIRRAPMRTNRHAPDQPSRLP